MAWLTCVVVFMCIAGPEHSSGRIERFLQTCDDDVPTAGMQSKDRNMETRIYSSNMQIAMPSTPANFFHLLRRQVLCFAVSAHCYACVQMKRSFRKPLIVFTPKSLLREEKCCSSLAEFGSGTAFRPVIPDNDPRLSDVTRVIFCSGKVAHSCSALADAIPCRCRCTMICSNTARRFLPSPQALRLEASAHPRVSRWCASNSYLRSHTRLSLRRLANTRM